MGFQATIFLAEATDYNTLRVSWQNPSGDWDRLRLVRSAYGFPAHEADGVVLVDRNSGPSAAPPVDGAVGDYLDSSLPPRAYYYTLFVRSTVSGIKWVRAGDAVGYSIADGGYLDYLLDRLPGVLTYSEDTSPRDSVLGKFLSIPAFHLNEYRALLDGLLNVNDPDLVPGPLLPSLMAQVGYGYEPEIGMRQNRVLARNATYLAKTKGTELGLTGLAASVTGFSSRIAPLTNLLLSQDDSSADQSVGSWTITGGTLTRDDFIAPPDADPSLDTYAQYTTEINRPGVFRVNASGTAVVSLGQISPVSTGVPVKAGVQYTLSAYFRSQVTPRQPVMAIRWYRAAGTVISTSTSPAQTITTTTGWTRNSYSATAPAGAVFASMTITWTTTSGEVQYYDAAQFQEGPVTAYRASRQVEVVLAAERVNEVINGGFDAAITGWTSTGGTASHTTTQTFDGGQGALRLSLTAATGTISRSDVVVDPDRSFVLQARVLHQTGVAMSAAVRVQFFNSGNTSLGTFTGPTVSNSGSTATWIRPYIVTRSPVGATKATVTVTVTSTSGTAVSIDYVLGEHADLLQDYFDTRNNSGEVIFEGAVNASRAHLYRLLSAKSERFLSLAKDSLPLGCGVNVSVAAPRSARGLGSSPLGTSPLGGTT